MSQRCKRPSNQRSDDGPCPPSKRRKCRPTSQAEEDEAAALAQAQAAHWQPRPLDNLKISSIYNRSATEAPAELFRKDLISAMKLPDSEPLALDEYWVICDQWKQEWERGVQVPVNPDSLPEPTVTVTHCAGPQKSPHEFKLPKTKYIRITKDDNFSAEDHMLSNTPAKAEAACSYDLDDTDAAWLQVINGERAQLGLTPINEDQLERVIEKLELQCWDKIQTIMKNEEGLGIEYDENVICDVCRSPDSEEGNEMVFCDSCNICVHQACYGIMTIPAGQWLCCTCSLGQRPDCVLCPNKGGAMKSTRSGHKWAHVSCALWIPEVSIGCVEKMEPITKISSIPQSRWALICVLCRERVGACIQCSVKTCKTAYHVTCAFKHGLEMRAIIEDENADDGVKLRSYCQKHSVSSKKEKSVCSGSEDDDSKRKKRKDMTSEEKNQARAARLQEIEAEFDKHVSVKDIMSLEVDPEGLQYIYNYWKLKRRAGHNKPLLPPKSEDVDMLSHKQEQADLEKMKMFVQLRQDLERVRNLCYMVSRREKLSRSFFRLREQTFHKQTAVLVSPGNTMNTNAITAVIEANHGPSIYDRLYSHSSFEEHTLDFETILARIAGIKSPTQDSADEKKDLNGMIKDRKLNNPYKRLYFNGSSKRRSASLYGSSLSSASSSEVERKPDINNSSTENDKPSSSIVRKKQNRKTSESAKAAERRKNRLNSLANKIKSESSSEEEEKPTQKDWSAISKSRTLRRMEQELGDKNASCTDSDDLITVRLSKPVENVKPAAIYSDSDSSDSSTKNEDKSSNATSDSQQNKLKTKASVKEFIQSKPQGKGKGAAKKKGEEEKESPKKESAKKKDTYDLPSDLIVPQRQAAKKASENLKSTTTRTKEPANIITEVEVKVEKQEKQEKPEKPEKQEEKEKPKTKTKVKVVKDVKETKEKESKKEPASKGGKTPDIFDIDKEFDKEENPEILAYVPQRQAAKKAAEHIKSGLGKPMPAEPQDTDASKNKKELDKDNKTKQKENEIKATKKEQEEQKSKKEPEKITDKRKSSTSSSSTSSTSSSSSSSSSSETEEDIPPKKPQETPTPTENSKRNSTKDWPFLDKAAKSEVAKSKSHSSSSDSSHSIKKPIPKAKSDSKIKAPITKVPKTDDTKLAGKKFRRVADKKLKTSDKQPEPEIKPTITEREEPSRPSKAPRSRNNTRAKRQSNTSDRLRDVDVRPGNIVDSKRSSLESKSTETTDKPAKKEQQKSTPENRKRKSDEMGRDVSTSSEKSRTENAPRNKTDKESIKSSKLSSPIRKTDKKLTENKIITSPTQPSNLEKEIMERKATKDLNTKKLSKGTLDKLFEKRDKKLDRLSQPVKENKEPTSFDTKFDNIINKSPSKHKHNEEITVAKFNSTDLDHLSEKAQKEKASPRYKKPEPLPARLKKQVEEKHEEKQKVKEAPPVQKEPEEIKISPRTKSPEKYTNRSIFSPQQTKDSSEIFEFDNDMLNVNETADDEDGFSLPREEESTRAPLTFTFAGSELLFKEDSKEDSARETLNLVEKLRMELSKKSGTGHNENEEPEKEESEKRLSIEEPTPEIETKESEKEEVHQALEVRVEITEHVQYNEQNYPYPADIQMEVNKTMLPTQVSQQSDERWVPPSDPFPIDAIPHDKLYNDAHLLEMNKQFMPPEINTQDIHSHETHEQLNVMSKHNMILDDIHKEPHSPQIQDRLPHQTPFIEPASMDCMPSPSPYADMHQQAKWADSEVMPVRRSSSSSADSTESSMSQRNDDLEMHKRDDLMLGNHPGMMPEIPFGMLPQGMPTFPPSSLADALPYHPFSEASQFVTGPVSLFPPPNMTTQIPFPSPGAAMFPPSYGAQFPAPHSVIPPIAKPTDETVHFPSPCTAAFTSSSHNMALTAAMVSVPPQTPKGGDSQDEESPQVVFPQNEEVPESPVSVPVSAAPVVNNSSPATDGSVKSASSTPAGKKSPSKPTRTSARFISQQSKSPSKSPGKSPRQEAKASRNKDSNKRNSKVVSRGSYSQNRSRGRGRGRGRNIAHPEIDSYIGTNTIHNKLVGTVYDLDFDDDIANDNMADLRAMRERRRSTDIHDRKSESSYLSRDSSQSPKFTSPSHKISRSYTTDLRELKPPTPITDMQISKNISSPISAIVPTEQFPDIGQPVLPGPVDMRTYNSSFEPQQHADAVTYSNQILGEFATVGPQLCDIDDEYEKNLEMSLRSVKRVETVETPMTETTNLKVSLSDSRNQLKVKIKGPFLDSNYTSTVSVPSQTNVNLDPIDVSSLSAVTNVNSAMQISATPSSGTSNLRRMRKKELLRQYWTQDMNMDEPASAQIAGQATAPTTTPVSRTTITIPKAVASMTSIPTREDYKAVVDANMEKKRRKEKQSGTGYMRELRNLDLTIEDEGIPERRRSVGSTGSNASGTGGYEGTYKRKGRPPRQVTQPTTPKLKIKIGGNFMGDTAYSTIDDKKYKGRPPKKRLTTIPLPSVEDLKRESMKYRRMVMADFDEEKKRKKGEKGKRKKRKSKHEVQIISNESVNKLIIRIGKKKEDGNGVKTDVKTNIKTDEVISAVSEKDPLADTNPQLEQLDIIPLTEPPSAGETTIPTVQSPTNNTTASDLRKVRSIKLKFARCQEGSGYVMKSDTGQPPPGGIEGPEPPTISLSEPPTRSSPPRDTPCTPLPLNKDCEVR